MKTSVNRIEKMSSYEACCHVCTFVCNAADRMFHSNIQRGFIMQNTVRNTVRIAALSAIFGVGSGAASALHAAEDAVIRAASPAPDRIERRQMTEDFSAKAQNNRSKKEAQAAYAEALQKCKPMSKSELAACQRAS